MRDTLDLSPDLPAQKPGSTLELVATPSAKLSPTQRAFKRYVADIEVAELQLKEIAELLNQYRPRYQQKLDPLQDALLRLNREMVLFLDQQLMRRAWTANQRSTMKEILLGTAETLFESPFHAEIETIFDRHSDLSYEEASASEAAMLEADLAAVFGMKPPGSSATVDGADENAPRSADQILDDAMRFLDEEEAALAREAEARAAAKRGRRKSAGPTKAEQQAIDTEKLLKDIYRKLTRVLHPDREPDEAERKRKTGLMSEANKAYESRNLLALLQLQLEASKLDSRAAATLADDQLKVVNQGLAEQLRELQLERHHLEMMVREEFLLTYNVALRPEALERSLKSTVAGEVRHIKEMRRIFNLIQQNDASFKLWLKEERALANAQANDDVLFEQAMLSAMMEELGRKPRGGKPNGGKPRGRG